MRKGPFSLFFFFFFGSSLFKPTEICFGTTKMGRVFYREKAFNAGKNQEKWLCPLWKIFLLCPAYGANLVLRCFYQRTIMQSQITISCSLYNVVYTNYFNSWHITVSQPQQQNQEGWWKGDKSSFPNGMALNATEDHKITHWAS